MVNQQTILNNLKTSIVDVSDLSEENWKILAACLTIKMVVKGDFLLKTGDFCDAVFFIHKGYCRLFQDNDGKEVNLNFHFENEFTTNIKSYINKKDRNIQYKRVKI